MRTPDTSPASPAPNRAQVSQASTLIGAGLAGGVSLELAMKNYTQSADMIDLIAAAPDLLHYAKAEGGAA